MNLNLAPTTLQIPIGVFPFPHFSGVNMNIKTLRDFPVVPMSEAQSKHLLDILLSSNPEVNQQATQEFADNLGFIGKVFYARCAAHKVKITCGLFLFLILLMRTPGHSTLWVWTLFNMQKDENHLLRLVDWTNAFPMGVPSGESYEKAWDEQKGYGPGNNQLDDSANWVRGD